MAIENSDGGAGMKYISSSEVMDITHTIVASKASRCFRVYPSMVSPKGAAALNSGFTQPVPRQQRFKLRLAALRYREPAASESSWKAFHCAF